MLEFPTWKRALITILCALGIAFALPNALGPETRSAIPSWLPHQSVNLGLDLRGGAHLLLEVEVEEVYAERMRDLRGRVREAVRDAGVRQYSRLTAGPDFVSINITNDADVETARRAMEGLAEPVEGSGGLGGGMNMFGGGGGIAAADTLEFSAEGNRLTLTLSEAEKDAITDRTIAQSLEVIRRRVDEAGTREPTIQRQGIDRVLVQVPGVGSADEVLSLIGQTARLSFHDVAPDQGSNPGPGQVVLPDMDGGPPLILEEAAVLTGERLTDASLGFEQETGLPAVNFRFDSVGAAAFGEYTVQNVGRPFAIVLDGRIISAPVIRSPILGGSGIITGDFTVETAQELAILLRAGALPASISVLEQRTVGPDLGADSIAAG
ncbi:MAG: protein translocase subunit SecD, partial [Pseudomonadota bacterium]